MTQTSSMMGSPYYMSPEQMTNSKGVDARADVWALGIILYELLTGRVPFDGETVPEIVANVLQNPPPAMNRQGLPAELEGVVFTALARDRNARQPDVAALAVGLAPFGPAQARTSVQRVSRLLGVSAEQTLPDGAAQRASVTSFDVNAETTFDGAARTNLDVAGVPKRNYTAWLGGGLALLAGAVGFLVYTLNSSPAAAPTDVPTGTAAPGPSPHLESTPPSPPSSPSTQPSSPPTPPGSPPTPPSSPSTPPSSQPTVADGKSANIPTTSPTPTETETKPASASAKKSPKGTLIKPVATPVKPSSEPPATPTPPKPKPSVDLFTDRK